MFHDIVDCQGFVAPLANVPSYPKDVVLSFFPIQQNLTAKTIIDTAGKLSVPRFLRELK